MPGVVAMERIAAMLAARRDELAEESLRAIRAGVPAYGAIEDPSILTDVTEHVAENHDALRSSLVRGRPVTSEDLAFIAPHAALRARRGVALADFLHAFRVGHHVLWGAIALGQEQLLGLEIGLRRMGAGEVDELHHQPGGQERLRARLSVRLGELGDRPPQHVMSDAERM